MSGIPFGIAHAQQLKLMGDAGFVGDDRHIYYSVAEIDDGLQETRSLWLFDLADSGTRGIGEGLEDLGAPAPSPDGRSLAVLAEVEGIRQICLIPIGAGPARPLTALPQGVSGRPSWSPDGRSIAFTAGPAQQRDRSLPYRVDRVTYRFERVGYLDDVVTDIYVVDVASGSVRQLTSDRCMNSDPRWSPDGRSLSYLVSFPPDRVWTGLTELHVLDVEEGRSRALVGDWGAVLERNLVRGRRADRVRGSLRRGVSHDDQVGPLDDRCLRRRAGMSDRDSPSGRRRGHPDRLAFVGAAPLRDSHACGLRHGVHQRSGRRRCRHLPRRPQRSRGGRTSRRDSRLRCIPHGHRAGR